MIAPSAPLSPSPLPDAGGALGGTLSDAVASWDSVVWTLLAAALLCAVADATLAHRQTTWVRWSTKALVPALLLLAVAGGSVLSGKPAWSAVLAAGALCLCLLGDLFLLEPHRIVAGGVAFAGAHALFIAALLRDAWAEGWPGGPGVWIALVFVAIGLIWRGWPVASAAPRPVLRALSAAYLLLVAGTVLAAGVDAAAPGGGFALAGAAFFLFSDLLLLRRRFVTGTTADTAVVMATYHLALISLTLWALVA